MCVCFIHIEKGLEVLTKLPMRASRRDRKGMGKEPEGAYTFYFIPL